MRPTLALLPALLLAGCSNMSKTGGAWAPTPIVSFDTFRDSTNYLSAAMRGSRVFDATSLLYVAGWRCPGREQACDPGVAVLAVSAQQERGLPLTLDAPLFVAYGSVRARYEPAKQEVAVGGGFLGQNARNLAYRIPMDEFVRMATFAGEVKLRVGEMNETTFPLERREPMRLLLARGFAGAEAK